MVVEQHRVVEKLSVVDKPILEGGSRSFNNKRHAEGRHTVDGFVVGSVESEGTGIEGGPFDFTRNRIALFLLLNGENPGAMIASWGRGEPTNELNKQFVQTLGPEVTTCKPGFIRTPIDAGGTVVGWNQQENV